MLYTIHQTLYTLHSTLYTIYYILYTIYYILYTMYIIYYATPHCTWGGRPGARRMPASLAAALNSMVGYGVVRYCMVQYSIGIWYSISSLQYIIVYYGVGYLVYHHYRLTHNLFIVSSVYNIHCIVYDVGVEFLSLQSLQGLPLDLLYYTILYYTIL